MKSKIDDTYRCIMSPPRPSPIFDWTRDELVNPPVRPGWDRNTLEREEDRVRAEAMATLLGFKLTQYDGGIWIEGGPFTLDNTDIGRKLYAVSWPMAIELMKAMQFPKYERFS